MYGIEADSASTLGSQQHFGQSGAALRGLAARRSTDRSPGAAEPARRSGTEPSPRPLAQVLRSLQLTAFELRSAAAAAARNGTDAAAELVAAGRVTETDLAAAIGAALDLPREAVPENARPTAEPPADARPRLLKVDVPQSGRRIYLAPPLESLDGLSNLFARKPEERAAIGITTAGDLERHIARVTQAARSEAARLGLSKSDPDASAKRVVTGSQAAILAAVFAAALALLWRFPTEVLRSAHAIGAFLFLGCVSLRLLAITTTGRRNDDAQEAVDRPSPGPPPIYSVLVALYQESAVIPDLVDALARLNWPRSKLDVKLICEADDPDTIRAAEAAIRGRPGFTIVCVPPSLPRTKPKALNFALPLAKGEFVVLYDAEDRPHPDQLLEAFLAFRRGGPRLACLQAPLTIRNGAGHWLAGHFALEYAALFRGFLPWLARHGLPLPLGGTSNHFRRSALVAVGAWDSHNVTEDADLGMRLGRRGYRIGVIRAPTSEDAPIRWKDWRNQRTRWMKGWMQSWLVHMRHPLRLFGELGLRGFVTFQLLFFGMIVSSIAHPLFAGMLGLAVLDAVRDGGGFRPGSLLAVDVFNVVFGYLSFVLLAWKTLTPKEREALRPRLWTVEIYWLQISLAALRAFGQLIRAPHRWEKTPHERSTQAPRQAANSGRIEPIFDVDR